MPRAIDVPVGFWVIVGCGSLLVVSRMAIWYCQERQLRHTNTRSLDIELRYMSPPPAYHSNRRPPSYPRPAPSTPSSELATVHPQAPVLGTQRSTERGSLPPPYRDSMLAPAYSAPSSAADGDTEMQYPLPTYTRPTSTLTILPPYEEDEDQSQPPPYGGSRPGSTITSGPHRS